MWSWCTSRRQELVCRFLLLFLCVTAKAAQQAPTPQPFTNADVYRSFVGEWEGMDQNAQDGEIPIHISITVDPLQQRMQWETVYGHKKLFHFDKFTRYWSLSPSRDTLTIEVRHGDKNDYYCEGLTSLKTGSRVELYALTKHRNVYGQMFKLTMSVDNDSLSYNWQSSTDKVNFQPEGSFHLKRVTFSKPPWMK